jgi:hypothetical protein
MDDLWEFVIGLALGGIPAGLAVYFFSLGQNLEAVIALFFTYLVIFLYEGATSGASSVFGIMGIFQGFLIQNWNNFFIYMGAFLGCFVVYWFSKNR